MMGRSYFIIYAAMGWLSGTGGDVYVKCVYLRNGVVTVCLLELNSCEEDVAPKTLAWMPNTVLLRSSTASLARENSGRRASWGMNLYLWGCTITNKRVTLDCMGSHEYLVADDTGENNSMVIRCGTSWGCGVPICKGDRLPPLYPGGGRLDVPHAHPVPAPGGPGAGEQPAPGPDRGPVRAAGFL